MKSCKNKLAVSEIIRKLVFCERCFFFTNASKQCQDLLADTALSADFKLAAPDQ